MSFYLHIYCMLLIVFHQNLIEKLPCRFIQKIINLIWPIQFRATCPRNIWIEWIMREPIMQFIQILSLIIHIWKTYLITFFCEIFSHQHKLLLFVCLSALISILTNTFAFLSIRKSINFPLIVLDFSISLNII